MKFAVQMLAKVRTCLRDEREFSSLWRETARQRKCLRHESQEEADIILASSSSTRNEKNLSAGTANKL